MGSARARWGALIVLTLCATLLVEGAQAGTSQCSVVSVVSVRFGTYRARERQPLDGTGTIAIECRNTDPGTTVAIELGRSTTSGFDRTMTARGRRIEYNLYLDPNRTQIWGDGSSGTGVFRARPVDGRVMSIPVYARMPPNQGLPRSLYSDVVMITLQY